MLNYTQCKYLATGELVCPEGFLELSDCCQAHSYIYPKKCEQCVKVSGLNEYIDAADIFEKQYKTKDK